MNLLGDILNTGDNVEDQEDYGFTGSFFKIVPTVIYEYTKNKLINMQLENLRSHINMKNIDKKYDERNQMDVIDDKEYDERDKIGEKQRINIEYRYLIFESDKIDF